jgi:dethiobiotin synthetase
MRGFIVAGIGTEVGKSVASAVLCEALGARYWKPVASGADDGPAESATVAALISNGSDRVFPETYLFGASLSPHVASRMEGVTISLDAFRVPESNEPLIVELAGGVLVPLSDSATNLDLIRYLDLPVIVVSRHYLGSINHTLLTLEVLKAHGVTIHGLLFNGDELPDTERIIVAMSKVRALGRIPNLPRVTPEAIAEIAVALRGSV